MGGFVGRGPAPVKGKALTDTGYAAYGPRPTPARARHGPGGAPRPAREAKPCAPLERRGREGPARTRAQPLASSDRELVERCLARDERAYRELVRRYQSAVLNLAWRITGNAEDAAEVAQETFVRVLRSLGTYDPTRPLRSWLFKIAANLALDSIRRRKRMPLALEDLADDEGPVLEAVEPGPGPEAALDRTRAAERFQGPIEELPEHYRAILHLRYREDLAYEEIAEALSIPLGTVKVRLHRAHEMLRRKLMARGKTT